jgi:hypothetical protein
MSRRTLCLLLLWAAVAGAQTVELPDGPCFVDLRLTRQAERPAWATLTLTAGPHSAEVGVSATRASIAAEGAKSTRDADGLPATGASAGYRLFRLADRLVLEREGRPLVLHRLALPGPASVVVRGAGCALTCGEAQPLEPVYASDDFLREEAAVGPWQPQAGEWRIGAYRDPLIARTGGPVQATWYEATTPGVSLLGESFWCDYAAGADVRASVAAGVAFAAQAGRWGLFRRDGDRAQLVLVNDGREQVLAQATLAHQPGVWERLVVVTSGDQVRAGVNGAWLLTATVPELASGRTGLWAAGRAEFDNFRAEETRLLTDPLTRPDPQRWVADERLTGRLAPFDAGEASVAARLTGDGSATLGLTGGAGVRLGLTRAGGELRWRATQGEQNVGAGVVAGEPGAVHRLGVRRRGPGFDLLLDERRLVLVYDAAAAPSAAQLQATGRAALADAVVSAFGIGPAAEIFRTDFAELEVPGKQQDEKWRVVGDLLQPAGGGWRHAANQMRGQADGQPVAVWYRDPVPGDAGVRVDLGELTAGARLSLLLNRGRGYALSVEREQARLLRDGREVARTALAGVPSYARLWRDGNWIAAELDGQRLAWHDADPLGSGLVGLRLEQGRASVTGFTVTAENGFACPFSQVDTLWRETGSWLWNTGMACIAWSYWVTADGRAGPAWLQRRVPLAHDVSVECHLSEFTEGYDRGRLSHRHFPYHDLSIVLDGDGRDPDSGYRLVVGAGGGRGIALLRRGQEVARHRDFTISMSDHANTPRSIHIQVERHGADVRVLADRAPVLTWRDPQPLTGGGHVGLGAKDCRANFSDLVALRYRAPQS